MVSSPMALPFAYFFCFITFFAYFTLSCPDSSVCDAVESPPYPDTALNLFSPNTSPSSCTGQCGDVVIYDPFFLDTSRPCEGKYGIRCDHHDPKESKPMIHFNGCEYVVKEIVHQEKVILLQDTQLGNYLLKGHCGFLYNFSDPIHNFSLPTAVPSLGFSIASTDCTREIDTFSTFLKLNDHHCNDYNIYYWDERMDHPKFAPNCSATEPSSFEWVLSFGGDDGTLSLKSAGFSRHFELREDCLYCQVTGKNCSSNSRGGCSCENMCEPQGKSGTEYLTCRILSIISGLWIRIQLCYACFLHLVVFNHVKIVEIFIHAHNTRS